MTAPSTPMMTPAVAVIEQVKLVAGQDFIGLSLGDHAIGDCLLHGRFVGRPGIRH